MSPDADGLMGPDAGGLMRPDAGGLLNAVQTSARIGRLDLVVRQLDYWMTVYKRTWRGSVISSFVMPFLYVAAMGVLLGGFIDQGPERLEGASTYLAFVAPGLVAAHAMQTATGEVMWPVMGMIKWSRTYYAMTATPLRPSDIVAAQLIFVGFRTASACGVFLAVLALVGVFDTLPGLLLAWLVQILLGLAFATVFFAISASMRTEAGFSVMYRLVVIPLFLFSGAFFPIANLSAPLEWLARVTPLWHGVDLTRMLLLERVDGSMALVHLAYLGAMVVLGWWLAASRLTKRLAR
jgi:lipooligosaccharide transport system permease protein